MRKQRERNIMPLKTPPTKIELYANLMNAKGL